MDAKPVINKPAQSNGRDIRIDIPPADGGESDFKLIRDAIREFKSQKASTLAFPKRVYHLDDPEIEKSGSHILIENLEDAVIDGSGAEFLCHHIRPAISIRNCRRPASMSTGETPEISSLRTIWVLMKIRTGKISSPAYAL